MVMFIIDSCFWIFEVLFVLCKVFIILLNIFEKVMCWKIVGLLFFVLGLMKVFLSMFSWLLSMCIFNGFILLEIFVWMILELNELYWFENLIRDLWRVKIFCCIRVVLISGELEVVRVKYVLCKVFFKCVMFNGMIRELVRFINMFFISKVMEWWILNFGLVNVLI